MREFFGKLLLVLCPEIGFLRLRVEACRAQADHLQRQRDAAIIGQRELSAAYAKLVEQCDARLTEVAAKHLAEVAALRADLDLEVRANRLLAQAATYPKQRIRLNPDVRVEAYNEHYSGCKVIRVRVPERAHHTALSPDMIERLVDDRLFIHDFAAQAAEDYRCTIITHFEKEFHNA